MISFTRIHLISVAKLASKVGPPHNGDYTRQKRNKYTHHRIVESAPSIQFVRRASSRIIASH